jgi:hypothetical protein
MGDAKNIPKINQFIGKPISKSNFPQLREKSIMVALSPEWSITEAPLNLLYAYSTNSVLIV